MSTPPVATPPVAERRPESRTLFGETVTDDLAWLQDRDDPAVLALLEAENAYTDAVLAGVDDLRQRLFDEIKSRIKETDLSVPVVKDDWAYYSRTEEGQAYPRHCRCPADAVEGDHDDGPRPGEQVLLDENAEADGHEFFDVGPFDVSPDHGLLCWGWDTVGDERFTVTVRDLTTGVSPSSAWSLDGDWLFYIRPDHTNRPHEVWRHRLGTEQADDVLVFTEPDERFFVGIGLEKDDSFIQIVCSSKVTDEVRVVPAEAPETEPRLIAERRQGVEYSVAHRHDAFVILTNAEGAQNFKVMTTPDADPGPENWAEVDLGDDAGGGGGAGGTGPGDVMISDIDVTDQHLVLFERADGLTRIRVRRWSDGHLRRIEQPEAVSTVWPGANPDFASTHLRYGYSSMVTPTSLYSVDLESGKRTLLKQTEVLGTFDPAQYRTERHWADAGDGARVPISIVERRDRPAGPGPVLLYGYGAYEASMDPMFSSARLSLLDRGFAFAIAHVRGGGEMGRAWYLDGKFERKHHSFDDFVACARHLIDEGRASADQLVIRGGSAGGLLVGAALNQAPELFAAVVAQVPFVDALNTMLDVDLPLTVTEWEEWGNPAADEDIYRAMRAYTPYENIRPVDYPTVLATGGLNDTRVGFWEPAKWVQALRQTSTGSAPILLWSDLGAGHGGPSGRYDAWREEARILAYILWALGLTT
ncbi:MAG: S9 family peptidase [Actinomycetota bacterium]